MPGPTRLQFIVPNDNMHEQFDLYGVINNVVQELLDPRRHPAPTGGAAHGNQFHFLAPQM